MKEIRHEYGRVLADAGNRYQYYLTDHLGNTRVVLQEDPANFTVLATFEPDNLETESMQFMDYGEAPHIASSLFDHTGTSDTGYALRLTNGETGPSRSVAVLPGDTVRMEVFGKYMDLGNKKADPALMLLSMAIEAASPGTPGIDGNLSSAASRISGTEQGLSGLLVGKEKRNDAPPAYLNYLFFDKEMNYKYGGYVQMTEAAYEDGSNREHERLYQEVVAEEPGYFYIYLSNDGTEGGEAYFDDFTILTLESYIVQQTDYYPYGLIARNFVRAGEKETKELFQGKTYEELTGWYDFHARQYDAALGRWFGVDAYTHSMPDVSPFNAMANNPVMFVDPDGNEPITTLAVLGFLKAVGIGAAKGAAIAGAFYTGGVAISDGGFNNWNWNAFGSAVGGGAIMGGATAGVSVLAQVAGQSAATAKGLSVFMSGSVNMMNHHDAGRGFGFHSLGYFAAGGFGAAAGIEGGLGLGIAMGGTANVIAGFGAGDISSGYGMAQHFVGGGLSSIAGRQHYKQMSSNWEFPVTPDKLDVFFDSKGLSSGARKSLSYGAQNVAARFAYTDRKYFTSAGFFNHLTGFAVGGASGYLQYELMGNKMLKNEKFHSRLSIPNKKLLYSSGFYVMEYAMNSSLIYNRQNWRGYFNYKAHSYFIKSLFYSSF